MSEPVTPLSALESYRTTAPAFILDQVKLFNKLGLADRMELLFFLLQNQALTITQIGTAVQMMRNKKGDN